MPALADFKRKAVQGLYDYAHFEAPSGAWIQRRHGEAAIVYCAAEGAPFERFRNIAAFKAFLEGGVA